MRVALVVLVIWCTLMLAWIAHDVNQTCGSDMRCRIEMESPQ